MKFEDIGKKFSQILFPNTILSVCLVGIRNFFGANITLHDIFIYNIMVGIFYILLWHELRIKGLEVKI